MNIQAKSSAELCKSDSTVKFKFQTHNGYKLNEEERNITGQPITLDELTYAVKRLKKGKTPGCDGLSPEVLVLWDVLGPLLLKVYNAAIKEGKLHLSAR